MKSGLVKSITKLGFLLLMGASMSAEAGLFGVGGTSWKEEVLLHDGSKVVAERRVERGGRHEIGQQPPTKQQSLTFTLPTINERITWKSEFSKDVGLADFQPLLLAATPGDDYLIGYGSNDIINGGEGNEEPWQLRNTRKTRRWQHGDKRTHTSSNDENWRVAA